jgi:hypothetical protein
VISDVGTLYRIGSILKKGLEGAAAIASGGTTVAGSLVRKAAGSLWGVLWKSALTKSFHFGMDYGIPDKRPFYKKHKTSLIILAIILSPILLVFIMAMGGSGALVTTPPGS